MYLITKTCIQRLAGYVEQMDSTATRMTVREAFFFAGRLRLSCHLSSKDVHTVVEETAATLGLTDLLDALIGTANGAKYVAHVCSFLCFYGWLMRFANSLNDSSAISLDARKRVTIGVELVADPLIIFADEVFTLFTFFAGFQSLQ